MGGLLSIEVVVICFLIRFEVTHRNYKQATLFYTLILHSTLMIILNLLWWFDWKVRQGHFNEPIGQSDHRETLELLDQCQANIIYILAGVALSQMLSMFIPERNQPLRLE